MSRWDVPVRPRPDGSGLLVVRPCGRRGGEETARSGTSCCCRTRTSHPPSLRLRSDEGWGVPTSPSIERLAKLAWVLLFRELNDPPASLGWVVWVSRPPVADGFFLYTAAV